MKTVEPFQFSFRFNSFNSHVTCRSTHTSAHKHMHSCCL